MLQNGRLYTFCASKALHNAGILVANVSFNDTFDSFYFIETVIEAHDLADELGSLGHKTVVDRFVDGFKSVTESFLHVADSVQLSVVGTHHRAIVA